jgi:hypothetical protein
MKNVMKAYLSPHKGSRGTRMMVATMTAKTAMPYRSHGLRTVNGMALAEGPSTSPSRLFF